jgi:carbon-monoxide dehydrogenase medium subunit/6-hydroxypseudooxynicotine dehydrogenase subunit alpha
VKPPPFVYASAASLDEAVALLAEGDEETKVLAGGQSLLPLLNFRLARPSSLVDVNRVRDMDAVQGGADGAPLVIGALCRQATLERAPLLEGPWAGVREAVAHIGHYPIRVRGTVGGSIAHADPSAELAVVAVGLDAELVLARDGGRRMVAARDFFTGPFSTAIAPGELLVEVRLASPPDAARTTFEEFSQRAGDFALASVFAGIALENGRCTWARIALGGVAATPIRAEAAEARLIGAEPGKTEVEEAAALAADACEPPSDFHGSRNFRIALVRHLAARAIRRAATRASATREAGGPAPTSREGT